MTIEQKILSKLEPHATRIKDGSGNDFDYLPAVLLQIIQEQKRQAALLNTVGELLDCIKTTAANAGVESKTHIAALDTSLNQQIAKTASENQQFQTKLMRILVGGFVASTLIIGLAMVLLQRH